MTLSAFPKVKSNYVIDWKEASLIQSHYQSIIVFTILLCVSMPIACYLENILCKKL